MARKTFSIFQFSKQIPPSVIKCHRGPFSFHKQSILCVTVDAISNNSPAILLRRYTRTLMNDSELGCWYNGGLELECKLPGLLLPSFSLSLFFPLFFYFVSSRFGIKKLPEVALELV